MRRAAIILVTLLAGLPQAAYAAEARGEDFCVALANLANEAAAARQVQTITVISVEPDVLGCSMLARSAVQNAFCDVVAEHVSIEFVHLFPWKVHDCLQKDGIADTQDAVDEYTGTYHQKIVRLRSTLRSGVVLDIAFTPDPAGGDKPGSKFHGLYGWYKLTLTPKPAP